MATPQTSPLVSLIARAAAGVHGADAHGAIVALTRIASVSILERGLVASDEWRSMIDAVAVRHLKLGAADRQLTRALEQVGDPQLRNDIEVAHAQVLDAGELAHYYAGLLAGLTLIEYDRGRR